MDSKAPEHNKDILRKGRVRQRRWAPRAKTGCITCSCHKCGSTGRRCDGYEMRAQLDQSNTTRRLAPMPSAWDFVCNDSTELDNFSFFQSVTTSTLAGIVDSGFWSRQLLQFSHHYPALWHGMTALACLHRDYLNHDARLTPPGAREIRNMKFALKQYNKSIQSLTHLCSKPNLGMSERIVVLATCALFACVCSLQNCQQQAFMHIRNGLKIILEWEADCRNVSSCQDYIAGSMLVLIFTRLDSQVIPYMFATDDTQAWIDRPVSPLFTQATFTTLFGAYTSIEAIYNGVVRLVWRFNKRGLSHRSIAPAEIEAHGRLLQAWDDQLATVLQKTPELRNSKAVDLLMVRRKLTELWYCVELTPGEIETDLHVADCVDMVNGVVRILGDSGDEPDFQGTTAAYSLETGIVEPLFWVAVRCREPNIRRRALRLLQQYPRREGICDSTVAFLTAQKVMEIEEAGCPRASGAQRTASPCTAGQWVCENHRVATWDFSLVSESQVVVVYKTVEDCVLDGPGVRIVYSWW
ncbi:uncharacterized protein BO97DRAFT_350013 [Aspergillus homomorphus CBS 101889]|uniref:Zn(2)-C6 fungal-type domain-containing protein n=1 Tax=Aspergillus homomorphus (strain CBS 101889) TaxID=1450537 RepID=A0A395HQM0_ASPHC|nr:hypothetical protein BO97DRAFT_350013 [Aspergillus homomorphus CBS 101889]RAL10242.1 hypothetical protein BO97DRAFT_350013 [Aspergillus homomorphus CBS 101889]